MYVVYTSNCSEYVTRKLLLRTTVIGLQSDLSPQPLRPSASGLCTHREQNDKRPVFQGN